MTSLGTRRSHALIAVLGTVLALALPTGGATHAGTTLRCLGKRATVVGTTGDDRLRGTPRDDVIVGMGGNDRIDGSSGNDRICESGPGSSVILAGPGRDRVSASSEGGVSARGGPGDDVLRLGGEGDSFDGPDSFDGGAGDDVLIALGAWSGFSTETGNDTIRTTVPGIVGFGFSTSPRGVRLDLRKGLLTGRGRTTIHLAAPSEVSATGSHFADVMIGSAGIDAFTGRAGDDVLVGSGGGDELAGGAGRDRISGGPGPDRIKEPKTSDLPAPPGGYGRDVVHAGPGDDTVGFDSDDRVYAGGGDDAFLGQFAPGSRQVVAGGPGVNTFDATVRGPSSKKSWAHVLIDLGRGRVDADGHVTRFAGIFRTLVLHPKHGAWTLNGTDGPDQIFGYALTSAVPIVEHGRAGDDLLVSGLGDDELWGGLGTDQGYAGEGTDACHSIEAPAEGSSDTLCETSTP